MDVHTLKTIPPAMRPNDPGPPDPPALKIHAHHDPGSEFRTGDGRRAPQRPRVEPRTPPEPAVDIRLIARDAVLKHLRKSQPLSPVIRGDVAWIGEKLIGRWQLPGAYGGIATGYAELALDADLEYRADSQNPQDIDLTAGAVILDWSTAARGPAPHEPQGTFLPFDPTTDDDRKIRKFIDDYGVVASMLGIVESSAFRLFQPGPIIRAAKLPPGLDIEWSKLLVDHLCGLYGRFGESSDTPLTPGEVFSLGFQPISRQNDHAVQGGHGAVRSSWILPDAVQAQFPQGQSWQTRLARTVEIVTVLTGGSARTEMRLGTHNEAFK